MKKLVYSLLLTLLLMTTSEAIAQASKQLPPEIQRLTDQAFRYYSTRQTDNYFATVKKVKKATETAGYEETYYRMCSYEAENIHKEQFGDERLQALLQHDLGDARETSETIHRAVEEFVGDAEPSDDLTKMCIKM